LVDIHIHPAVKVKVLSHSKYRTHNRTSPTHSHPHTHFVTHPWVCHKVAVHLIVASLCVHFGVAAGQYI
jgi:hypothetical protein